MTAIFDGVIRGELMVDLMLLAIVLGAYLGGKGWRR
jgi:hypothetical protein